MELFWYTVSYIPSFGGALIAIIVIILLALFAVNKKNNFAILFVQLYEQMFDFFADILWENELAWIKSFVTNMFFVILLYNILWLLFDLVWPIFGYLVTGEPWLSQWIGFGTSNVEFNVGMAIIGVLMTLGIQLITMDWNGFLGKKLSEEKWNTPFFKAINFIYEYVPFWWKDIITIEKWDMHPAIFYPAWVLIKTFDIIISLFVWFLDIIGILAKVISLAFRLFGNMLSGTVLLTVLMVWLWSVTASSFGVEFPIIAPIILIAQGLLVACIQALVFPLLLAIYVKVARMGSEEEEATA